MNYLLNANYTEDVNTNIYKVILKAVNIEALFPKGCSDCMIYVSFKIVNVCESIEYAM